MAEAQEPSSEDDPDLIEDNAGENEPPADPSRDPFWSRGRGEYARGTPLRQRRAGLLGLARFSLILH